MANRLRVAGLVFVIFFVALPVAMLVTIIMFPFWSWVESTFGIESIGHSGPAGWCYWVSYIIILIGAFLIWRAIRRNTKRRNTKLSSS